MKYTLFVFLTLCLSKPIYSQNSSFDWPDAYQAALSLSFDDARLSNVDVGLDLFREYGAKVTYYVNPGPMEPRLAAWKQAVLDGHEIGNHSVLHPCSGNFPWSRAKALDSYSLSSMRKELEEANQQIENMLGVKPQSFAYPCGQTYVGRGTETQSYVPLIAELFESGRGWLNEAPNDPLYVDFAQVQGIEMDGKDFTSEILPLLEAARESGTWIVLAGHEIGEAGFQTTHTNMLRELLAYVNDPANKIWLAPVGEVAHHVSQERGKIQQELSKSLVFASTFDLGYEADYFMGNKYLYSAPSYDKADSAQQGVDHPHRSLASKQGKYGHALSFTQKEGPVLFYSAYENVPYDQEYFEGTISLWLSLDPETDLEPGYTDPIQITDSGYDDAALWVDFSDKNPRDFRMGVYGDVAVWNPDKISPDKNPAFNERLLVAQDRPFSKGNWTHVAISFAGLNTDEGFAEFYINGVSQGRREIPEPFTWDWEKANIYLGLNFVGLIDELALFERGLDAKEIQSLYLLAGGLHTLLDQKK